MRPSSPTTAAQVSSQLVSIARITAAGTPWLGVPRSRGGAFPHSPPHDERVLAVVVVVGTAAARGPEAEALIQADGGLVRRAHLERVLLAGLVGFFEEPLQQRAG